MNKDEVFKKFKTEKTLVETQTKKKIKMLRINNSLKFYNKRFDDYCTENRIARHKTINHTLQWNGLADK